MRERLRIWIAWHLPRGVAYWCFMRVAAHATEEPWSGESPDEVSVLRAAERWEKAVA